MSYIGKGVEVVTFNTATTLDVAGNITVGGTVDGRDVATDGTKLDTIAANAIANLSEDTTPQLGGNLDLNTSNVIGTGNINVTGSITGTSFVSTGDMSFTNNSKAIFGTSPSLEIYHDGSNSILDDVGAGNFKMQLAGADKLEITSTGVDVTGTVTSDNAGFYQASGTSQLRVGASSAYNWNISRDNVSTGGLQIQSKDAAADVTRAFFALNGDISFYNDTGVTQGFFWDASTQRLGLGTTSPSEDLHIKGQTSAHADVIIEAFTGYNSGLNFHDNAGMAGRIVYNHSNNFMEFDTNGSEAMRIDSSGNVGIGESSPDTLLQLTGDTATITIEDNSAYSADSVTSRIYFAGRDAAGSNRDLANIAVSQHAGGNGTGSIDFQTRIAGTTASRMRIDSSGNVGIGTSSPTSNRQLTLYGNDAGLQITGSAVGSNAYLTSTPGSSANFYFGTTSAKPIIFVTNGATTERMRIDSSGNLLVGTTSYDGSHFNDTSGGGFAVTSAGKIDMKVNGTVANFNRTSTSDGDILYFAKQGASVGSIGTQNDDLTIGTGDTGLQFRDASDAIRPFNISTNAARDASIDLGRSTERFRNLFLSGGVYLGGTGSANHLDDYEEGTLSLSSTTGTAFFGGITYTKVGNQVTVRFYVENFSDTSTASAIAITGLPYASSSTNQATGSVLGKFADTIGGDAYIAYVGVSSSTLLLFKTANNANYSQIQHSHLTSASAQFIVTLTYEAA